MTKSAPRIQARARARKPSIKAKPVPIAPLELVTFSYQDIPYQIDLEKSKVYRKFIEIEKSRQFSIINAYRSISVRPVL